MDSVIKEVLATSISEVPTGVFGFVKNLFSLNDRLGTYRDQLVAHQNALVALHTSVAVHGVMLDNMGNSIELQLRRLGDTKQSAAGT